MVTHMYEHDEVGAVGGSQGLSPGRIPLVLVTAERIPTNFEQRRSAPGGSMSRTGSNLVKFGHAGDHRAAAHLWLTGRAASAMVVDAAIPASLEARGHFPVVSRTPLRAPRSRE
jgi:hypothetical protein